MAYIKCESCGAKALVAASRCPRCAAYFHLLDGRGERVKLVKCGGCGIMHRRDTACHWCPPQAARTRRTSALVQSLAAAALFAVIGASSWTYGSRVQDFVSDRLAGGPDSVQDTLEDGAAAEVVTASAAASVTTAAAPFASADPADSPVVSAAVTSSAATATIGAVPSAAADSVRWVPVVARTWVNIRTDAGRRGSVVGIIKPASRAMLGTTGRAGWRQVRSGDTTGWVDSRLFEADSLAIRG